MFEDLDDPVPDFQKPWLEKPDDTQTTANNLRDWLDMKADDILDFESMREKLEQKGIFVFLTSKYKSWSHIKDDFRGLSITDKKMPIIVINSSDSRGAQYFTLIHELGHILKGETRIDGDENSDSEVEKWCDSLAGNFLMPQYSVIWNDISSYELSAIKKLAEKFKVSPYACLVRLRQLKEIDQQTYEEFVNTLAVEYSKKQEKLRASTGGPRRNRTKEVYEQFGNTFIRTILTSWKNQEMTLHKTTRLLDLKHPQQVIELETYL